MHNFRLHVRDTLLEMIEMCYILVLSMQPPKLFENESHELFMHEYLHFQINPPSNPTWFNIPFLLYKQDWIDVFNKENPFHSLFFGDSVISNLNSTKRNGKSFWNNCSFGCITVWTVKKNVMLKTVWHARKSVLHKNQIRVRNRTSNGKNTSFSQVPQTPHWHPQIEPNWEDRSKKKKFLQLTPAPFSWTKKSSSIPEIWTIHRLTVLKFFPCWEKQIKKSPMFRMIKN